MSAKRKDKVRIGYEQEKTGKGEKQRPKLKRIDNVRKQPKRQRDNTRNGTEGDADRERNGEKIKKHR